MKKIVFVFIAVMYLVNAGAQITSSKKGDISYGDKVIVEMEKYEGSAETRPKFRLLSAKKDTLLLVRFNKDFAFDWMTFTFKEQKKTVEVNSSEIIKGLNYQKNLGSFLVDNNIFDSLGNINAVALEKFAAKYNEDLATKYKALNEGNRLVAATKFDYRCDDNSIHVNGRHVGYAVVPANQQMNFSGIQFKDINNKVLVSGDLGPFGGTLKGVDGKEVKLGMPGKTTDCAGTMGFVTNILRELFRNGYYRS
jgi:hypothetical protein